MKHLLNEKLKNLNKFDKFTVIICLLPLFLVAWIIAAYILMMLCATYIPGYQGVEAGQVLGWFFLLVPVASFMFIYPIAFLMQIVTLFIKLVKKHGSNKVLQLNAMVLVIEYIVTLLWRNFFHK